MLDGDCHHMSVCSFPIDVVIRMGAEEVKYVATGSTPNHALTHTIFVFREKYHCCTSTVVVVRSLPRRYKKDKRNITLEG